MEAAELKAKKREKTGNGPARVLRREGFIPAVIYGAKKEPMSLIVGVRDLEDALKASGSGSTMLNLTIENDGQDKRVVMLKELQRHPLSRKFIHADFYEVDMKREIWVNVPVEIKGQAPGVEAGGTLQVLRRELEMSCLPMQIPQIFVVDVSGLEIGDSVHISDLTLPEGVSMDRSLDYTVVTVVAPRSEEKPGAVEEETEEAEEKE
ncbi:MAG: 50S ribosomal protein L25/general stress protein Ctc [Proteobacteria bacterium]|nr:50S ribosomal protein L25/general stress protein Ctc [Pseudomonadota bacterium]